jgi:hypothetical protein
MSLDSLADLGDCASALENPTGTPVSRCGFFLSQTGSAPGINRAHSDPPPGLDCNEGEDTFDLLQLVFLNLRHTPITADRFVRAQEKFSRSALFPESGTAEIPTCS